MDSIALSKMTFRQALKNTVELEDLYKLLENAEHMLLQLQKNTASVVVDGVETYISGDKSQVPHLSLGLTLFLLFSFFFHLSS
jgi:hypothetical protein